MVEMAVCFPLFMLIFLGIVEFGRALMVSQMLTNAAREACRTAVLEGATTSDVESLLNEVVVATVGVSASDIVAEITVTNRQTEATDNSSTALQGASSRDLVQVDISIPADAVSYTPGKVLAGRFLRGHCAMLKE